MLPWSIVRFARRRAGHGDCYTTRSPFAINGASARIQFRGTISAIDNISERQFGQGMDIQWTELTLLQIRPGTPRSRSRAGRAARVPAARRPEEPAASTGGDSRGTDVFALLGRRCAIMKMDLNICSDRLRRAFVGPARRTPSLLSNSRRRAFCGVSASTPRWKPPSAPI